jgi:hypothetical protein
MAKPAVGPVARATGRVATIIPPAARWVGAIAAEPGRRIGAIAAATCWRVVSVVSATTGRVVSVAAPAALGVATIAAAAAVNRFVAAVGHLVTLAPRIARTVSAIAVGGVGFQLLVGQLFSDLVAGFGFQHRRDAGRIGLAIEGIVAA